MIFAYLRQRIGRVVLDAVFVGIFALCFYLTDTQWYRLWYPVLLCLVFFFLYVMWDYRKFSKKHQHLEKMQYHIDETAENLPVPENQLEADYQSLLHIILKARKEQTGKIMGKMEGNKEYITLWAHQIKAPVTAMELMLQELTEENLDKKRRELSMSLFEIEQYVDASLQYMRLDSMTSDLILREYHLFDIVKQAVKYFARIFIAKRISLHIAEADVIVVTDEKWLLFVLKQLLSNALKYTREGEVSIYMKADEEQVLVIEDSGIGIAAEDLPRIYERGFTGCNGRMQKKSTGIGLYLSKTILEHLGHGIAISSKEGCGTSVELFFRRGFYDS